MAASQLQQDNAALLAEESAQPLPEAAPAPGASNSFGRRAAALSVALLLGCAGAAAVVLHGRGDGADAGHVAEASGVAVPQTHAILELFGASQQCAGCQCDCGWASQPGACNGHTNDCCSACCCGGAGVDPGFGVSPPSRPVDPGFGVDPPGRPVDPGFGVDPHRPVDPGFGVDPPSRPVDPGFGVDHPVDPGFGVDPGYDHFHHVVVGGRGDAYHGSYPEYHTHHVYYHSGHYHVYHHHHGHWANFWWVALFVILVVLTGIAMYFYFQK